jgi:hypothetical protein
LTRDPFIVTIVTGENLCRQGRSKAWGLAPTGGELPLGRDGVFDVVGHTARP